MKHLNSYGDERELDFCAFCGRDTSTRDHCPSRVLLNVPFPENLPVVGACERCNSSFSADEEYLACLVGCVLAGSTDPTKIRRPKIRRILSEKPALRARLEQARSVAGITTIFKPEEKRVNAVITKLAQGHALHELHMHCPVAPDSVEIRPLELMTSDERQAFEYPEPPASWPEVGSRAMQRLVVGGHSPEAPWLEVQKGLYRFHASPENGVDIRIVIEEYLACQVHWNP